MLVMPNINPEILSWARDSAGLTIDAAAEKLGLKEAKGLTPVERLSLLEDGEASPTRAQLVKMATAYRRPLLTFYLANPPVRADRGEDFRTLPDGAHISENALVDALLRNVKARQSMIKATLVEEGEEHPIATIGSMKIADGVKSVATSIEDTLQFRLDIYRQQTADNAFTYLRTATEKIGVFVLLMGNLGSHHTAVSLQLFRGFAIADEVAPVVVINDQDARTAWSFTLLHELAHLWLGKSGVSGASPEAKIEKFCNDVASEILLPAEDLAWFENRSSSKDDLVADISEFATTRNVSHSMVAYKLFRADHIDHETWISVSNLFRNQWIRNRNETRERSRDAEGGPNYYVVKRHKIGSSLIKFTQRMLADGAITTSKAGKILDIKPQNVHRLMATENAAARPALDS